MQRVKIATSSASSHDCKRTVRGFRHEDRAFRRRAHPSSGVKSATGREKQAIIRVKPATAGHEVRDLMVCHRLMTSSSATLCVHGDSTHAWSRFIAKLLS